MKIIDLEKADDKDCYDNVRKEVSRKVDSFASMNATLFKVLDE